jgi:hypothetical protein
MADLTDGQGGTVVTSEMVDAGVDAYLNFDRDSDPAAEIVRAIFSAMLGASQGPLVGLSNGGRLD